VSIRAWLFLLTAALWSGCPVYAGQLQTGIKIFSTGGQQVSASVQIQAADLDLTSVGTAYTYKWKSSSGVLALTDVAVSLAAPGYDTSVYSLDLPFYWDSAPYSLFGVVTNDPYDDASVQRFIDAQSIDRASMTDIANVFSLHERSVRLFRQRKFIIDQGASPLPCDVVLAYYVVFSARELADRRNVRMDQTTEDAQAWLLGMINKSPPPRCFRKAGVSAAVIRTISQQLSLSESTFYGKLINNLDGLMATDFDTGCARAQTLLTIISGLPDDEYQAATAQNAVHLRTATDVALCLATKFRKQQKTQEPFANADVVTARKALGALDTLLPNAQGAEKKNGEGRRADLQVYMASSSNGRAQ